MRETTPGQTPKEFPGAAPGACATSDGGARQRIRAVLGRVGRLPIPVSALADDSDLHDAGLTSFGTVEVVLSIEDAFGVEFPEGLITRARFSSIAAIEAAIKDAIEDAVEAPPRAAAPR